MIADRQIVDATLTRLEPYGIYLEFEDATILVLLPEASWDRISHPKDVFTIGTTYKVLVTNYVPTQQLYMASIRALDVANNPYIALSRNPAVEHHGRVQDAIGDYVTVYLDKNDLGMIAVGRIAANEGTSHLQSGDRVTVTVRSLDLEECELWLDLCESPAD